MLTQKIKIRNHNNWMIRDKNLTFYTVWSVKKTKATSRVFLWDTTSNINTKIIFK